ncbi:MAG: ATP synthase F1 subunit epsilon [Ignavibacteria bacterium]|nr:ATP synthase F1 subunit epsilon [Ignavibacteria bacterium]
MSAHLLSISIVTPQTTAFEGTALAVSVPGSYGPFQILNSHAPIISSLDAGVVKIEDENNVVTYFATKEGFVEVLKNNVNIVVEELVNANSIDVLDAETELKKAKQLADGAGSKHEKDRARNDVHWAEARIRAANLFAGV